MMNCQLAVLLLLAGSVALAAGMETLQSSLRKLTGRSVDYDFLYNAGPRLRPFLFRLGRAKTSEYVESVGEFSSRSLFRGCTSSGVLKITLSNSTVSTDRSRVLVDILMSNPSEFVFNIGDSSTNNGEGGDDGTQSNDAEIVGLGNDLKVFLNDDTGGAEETMTEGAYDSKIRFLIGDGAVAWSTDEGQASYQVDADLFALDDQSDSDGSENFDIYLALNRAIKEGTENTGSGACSVGIKFLPIPE